MSTGVEVTGQARGLAMSLRHGPSGSLLTTTPPVDNGGDGSAYSPTDLIASGLLACAITTMVLHARRQGLALGDPTGRVEKRMTGAPRRIGELSLSISMPAGLPLAHRGELEQIARTCPVARSLHPDVKVEMTFEYPG